MTAETNAAALAELETAFELGLNAATNRQPERIDIAIERFRAAAAALLRAGAAKVPEPDLLLADARALRKMLANTQTAVIAAVPLLVIDDMPGQIAELLHKTAYLRDGAPPAPDAGVVEPSTDRVLLQEAVDALAGGLWDYGPQQDEHTKCQELVDKIREHMERTQ